MSIRVRPRDMMVPWFPRREGTSFGCRRPMRLRASASWGLVRVPALFIGWDTQVILWLFGRWAGCGAAQADVGRLMVQAMTEQRHATKKFQRYLRPWRARGVRVDGMILLFDDIYKSVLCQSCRIRREWGLLGQVDQGLYIRCQSASSRSDHC